MEHVLKKGDATALTNELGGELTAFSIGELLYTWTGDAKYWSGKAPVLFPFVCSLKNNTVTIGGKAYSMEKHGFARKSRFKVAEKDDEHIVFELVENDETLKIYPFHFSLKITHTVLEDGFKTEYSVTNSGEDDMLFCIGGHPSFRVPLHDGESFSDYSLVFEKEEAPYAYYTENGLMNKSLIKKLNLKDGTCLPLCYEDFSEDALIFTNLKSQKLSVLKDGRGFEFSFAGFPALGIWTPSHKNAPFICLEPWVGLPAYNDEDGSFENKPHAITLASGKTFHICYSMREIR